VVQAVVQVSTTQTSNNRIDMKATSAAPQQRRLSPLLGC
jgi:hypothetical protein